VGGFLNSGKEPPGEEDRESSAGEWAKHQLSVEPPGGVKGKRRVSGCLSDVHKGILVGRYTLGGCTVHCTRTRWCGKAGTDSYGIVFLTKKTFTLVILCCL